MMHPVSLQGGFPHSGIPSEPADDGDPPEFGTGLRARLESTGAIGRDEASLERLALERKLLRAFPELAEWGASSCGWSPRRVPHLPLATLVYEAGVQPAGRLEQALAESERRKERIGRVLAEKGLVSEAELERLLADQRGMPLLDLEDIELDPRVTAILPVETARLFRALPLGYLQGAAVVALGDPTDELAIESIRARLNGGVRFVAGRSSDIADALRRLYRAEASAA